MFQKIRQWFSSWREDTRAAAARTAEREVLNTVFEDLYTNRRQIYRLNFFRGISFGLGSVLGGTLVVAIVIWILTWFVDFPLVGQWIEKIINALPSR